MAEVVTPVTIEGQRMAAPRVTSAHDQADRDARDHAVRLGTSGRGAVIQKGNKIVRATVGLHERPARQRWHLSLAKCFSFEQTARMSECSDMWGSEEISLGCHLRLSGLRLLGSGKSNPRGSLLGVDKRGEEAFRKS